MLICVMLRLPSARMSTLILSLLTSATPFALTALKFEGKNTRLLAMAIGLPKSPTSLEPFSQLKKPGELPLGLFQGTACAEEMHHPTTHTVATTKYRIERISISHSRLPTFSGQESSLPRCPKCVLGQICTRKVP